MEMSGPFNSVIIVGGGTAGWLSAAYLAARRPELSITVVEAPDIAPIGVGEGTWPTMRETLRTIGITESDFLRECDASFKQGSRFDGWVTGEAGDSYLHPFTPPPHADMADLLSAWGDSTAAHSFAAAMSPQAAVCAQDLAPRQRAMPDYTGSLNYAYHFDAGKFAELLAHHATAKLGVRHIRAHVVGIEPCDDGLIAALHLRDGDMLAGDFFIDCTGMAACLIGEHCRSAWINRLDVSFNDRALAVQVATRPDDPVASQTVGTAHKAGWLWDIALPKRRGIGCVYASRFMDNGQAEQILRDYIAAKVPSADAAWITPRKLQFATGHREKFWHGNCVAIGLSAGFIEPLEASAIVLIELSLRALAENYPVSREALPIHADRFNSLFRYRWERIVDFLKLHYVLSRRQEPYWQAQRAPESIPQSLADQLRLWKDQPPSAWDFPQVDEIFSAASQQYVLYGMGFSLPGVAIKEAGSVQDGKLFTQVHDRSRALAAALPSNRAYLDAIHKDHTETMMQPEPARI